MHPYLIIHVLTLPSPNPCLYANHVACAIVMAAPLGLVSTQ